MAKPKKEESKKAPAKKAPAKKPPAKKPASKKGKGEKVVSQGGNLPPVGTGSTAEYQADPLIYTPTPDDTPKVDVSLLSPTDDNAALIEAVNEKVTIIMSPAMQPVLDLMNSILGKTNEITEEDIRTGRIMPDWTRITPEDIETILLAFPIYQFNLDRFDLQAWADSEIAKIDEKDLYETVFGKAVGTSEGRKNEAYLKSATERYRAFLLKYASERIHRTIEGMDRICSRWSRVVEIRKLKQQGSLRA